ncbi:kelch repeat and BTB domain-containing protein 7-like [Neosynchiropus ocellatus]
MASVVSSFAGPEVLENSGHAGSLLKELKALYDSRLFGDVTIGVACDDEGPGQDGSDGVQLFLCSRTVLAAASLYFKSMFTVGLNESVQERVVIRGVDAESMSVIIDYCYTGKVSITEGNVQRLYAAANMLQLEYIRSACSGFMTRRLDLGNCVGVLKFADTYDNPELKKNAQYFIARNFSQLCHGGELCELDLTQLRELLTLDTLDVDCERKVCLAALKWIEANAQQKEEDALQALNCVRWNLFTEKDKCYLEELMATPLTEKSLECFNRSSAEELAAPVAPEIQKKRIGVSAKEMILFYDSPNNRIMCCDPYSKDLFFMAPPPFDLLLCDQHDERSFIACASPENDLYLASHLSKHFWLYNPALNSWQELAERPLARQHSRMGYLNGHVYLLGGRNPVTDVRLKEVECYSVQRNQWTFVAPLPHSLGKMQVVALNDHLYVVDERRMLCYDPKRDSWCNCGTGELLHDACVFQDQIICMSYRAMKAYNPSTVEWRTLLTVPSDNMVDYYQVMQHNNKLLLLTQTWMQRRKNRVLIQEYDPSSSAWKDVVVVPFSTLGPVCVSTRLYPAYLGWALRFSSVEEDGSEWD